MLPKRQPPAQTPLANLGIVGALAFFLILCLRGVLLWVVIPATAVLRLISLPYHFLRDMPFIGLRQTLAWADANLVALLTLGRLTRFVRWSRVSEVQHRGRLIDLV